MTRKSVWVLTLHQLRGRQKNPQKVPHQCCVARERTKFDFFERWLKSQNVQSLLLRDRRQAGDTKKHHKGHVSKAAFSHQNTPLYRGLVGQLTFLHPECCTGSSSRTPARRSHTRSCTAACLCSTCSRTQYTQLQPGHS